MAKTYTTISGDTWDKIAYNELGSEYYATELMNENRDKLEYLIFPAGVELKLPEVNGTDGDLDAAYPEWRAILNGQR